MPTTALFSFNTQALQPVYDHNSRVEADQVKLGNSLTLAKGTVLGQITATGLWIAYASGAVDGSQIPKAILMFDTATDGSGNHSIGAAAATGGPQGETYLTCPAYVAGDFLTAELTGLDATALTNKPSWTLRWGTVAAGCLRLP